MNNQGFSEADFRMQAMLYLLKDPALDAQGFESQLDDDDGRLAEILSETVSTLEALRAAGEVIASRTMPVSLVPAAMATEGDRHVSNWTWLIALAAGFVLIAFVGRQVLQTESQNPAGGIASNLPSSDALLSTSDIEPVLAAWAQFQADGQVQTSLYESDSHADTAWSYQPNDVIEQDVPDWLVLAASVVPVESPESDLN